MLKEAGGFLKKKKEEKALLFIYLGL